MKKTETYINFLTEEGFRPLRCDDGMVQFRIEGGSYLLDNNAEEDYCALYFPSFFRWEDSAEAARTQRVASTVTQVVPSAKIIFEDHHVHVMSDSWLVRPEDLKEVFYRLVWATKTAARDFRELMRMSAEKKDESPRE